MRNKARKITPKRDVWEDVQANLTNAASELAQADLDLVIKTGSLIEAQNAHASAVARQTKAENRLTKLRANLTVAQEIAS